MATAKINTIACYIYIFYMVEVQTTLKSYEVYHMELIEWF